MINEFKDEFNSMLSKFERSSIDFQDLKLKKCKIFKNNIQDYIKISILKNLNINGKL